MAAVFVNERVREIVTQVELVKLMHLPRCPSDVLAKFVQVQVPMPCGRRRN
jgi:hypothetical protein